MKFTCKNLLPRGPRLGELRDFENKPGLVLETPLAFLHTQGGHIPHITHEVFKLVCQSSHILQIPLVTMHQYKETMEYYEGKISEFIGSKDSITCLTLHDPANIMIDGHHVKGKVPIFTRCGKTFYDSETYMNVVESFKPDIYYLLSDGHTNKASSQKRILKAVENTVAFNKQCLQKHKNSDILKHAFVIAPIAGGFCVKSRKKCIEEIKENESLVHGYLIDGLHSSGTDVELLTYKEIRLTLESTIAELPIEKLICVQGCWNPVTILQMVKAGVDIFDTSYCSVLIERSAALTFSLDILETVTVCEINLMQDQYADDFEPMMDSCSCIACQGYTRSYIHHLLTVRELLGYILIMIHNIHHMLRFFEKIRENIRDNTFQSFVDHVTKQYNTYQKEICNIPSLQNPRTLPNLILKN